MPVIGEKLADFLFPPYCVACGQAGDWWCADCRGKCQRVGGKICPQCLIVVGRDDGHACVGTLPFHDVWALGYYHDPKLRPAITALKFQGVEALRQSIRLFLESHQGAIDIRGLDQPVIVPMPLSEKRLKERGFNQAELVAQAVQETLLPGLSVADCLRRIGHVLPQSSLEHDLDMRRTNIKDAFQVTDRPPKHVILVDDVITTGATAAEAASVILSAGAENVSVFCLAIGS
jgi:ComF family protein